MHVAQTSLAPNDRIPIVSMSSTIRYVGELEVKELQTAVGDVHDVNSLDPTNKHALKVSP